MKDCALVLEGGALRGVFTSGVLDVLMEQGLYLPYVIGVSAGSLNAFGYLSRQIGRSGRSNIEYAKDPRYLGIKNYVLKHSIFNFDFMFGDGRKNVLEAIHEYHGFHGGTEEDEKNEYENVMKALEKLCFE